MLPFLGKFMGWKMNRLCCSVDWETEIFNATLYIFVNVILITGKSFCLLSNLLYMVEGSGGLGMNHSA